VSFRYVALDQPIPLPRAGARAYLAVLGWWGGKASNRRVRRVLIGTGLNTPPLER
jgi:hypothetical protein